LAYAGGMKHGHFYQNHEQKLIGPAHVAAEGELNHNKMDFGTVPSEAEVATRAYFSYVNQGSLPGHALEHWLEAEAQLHEERKLTRTHGYPHDN